MIARSRRRPAVVDVVHGCQTTLPGRLRTAVGGGVGSGYRRPGQGHVARVLRVAYFHEREQIDVVQGEAVKVLEEQFPFLVGERLVMSVVSHALTLWLAHCW